MSPRSKRLKIIATMAALAWLAETTTPGVHAQNLQEAPVASSKLNLTMEQRYTIKEIVKGLHLQGERADIQPAIGQTIPTSVRLQPMPPEIGAKVSPIKNHDFFVKNNQVVIVDPKDRRVVDLIALD